MAISKYCMSAYTDYFTNGYSESEHDGQHCGTTAISRSNAIDSSVVANAFADGSPKIAIVDKTDAALFLMSDSVKEVLLEREP
jgi:hypothetical protein